MYTLAVDGYFWASHSVPMPDGSPEPAHSHNFRATAEFTASRLDDKGMAMDFCRITELLDSITSNIAQAGNIGRIDYFAENGQTAEVIAKYIFEKLRPALPKHVALKAVTVAEQPGCRATYAQ